eukprot:m.13782 g.13782  ORF g.13782 m.13782 type:complete len:52 (+) comp6011_c0_seq2:216-371(+)
MYSMQGRKKAASTHGCMMECKIREFNATTMLAADINIRSECLGVSLRQAEQ